MLAEKIRNINPRADIASIVLQSTPTAPVPSQTSWNSDGVSGAAPRPSSRGATSMASTSKLFAPQSLSANPPTTRPLVRDGTSPMPSVTSLSERKGVEAATVAVRSGGLEAMMPFRTHERGATAESAVKPSLPPGARKPHAAGAGSELPEARPEKESSNEEIPQASTNSRALEAAAARRSAKLAGSGGIEDAHGLGSVKGGRCSLMGRMLGSGMLERQREWAKARNRKVGGLAGGEA